MRFGEVVLAGVTDVDDVCNTKGFNDVCITSMVIIAQEEAAWENLIWIAFSNSPAHKARNVSKKFRYLRSRYQMSSHLVDTMVRIVFNDLIESANAQVDLSQLLLL